MKKFFRFVLTLCLCLALLSAVALATGETITEIGSSYSWSETTFAGSTYYTLGEGSYKLTDNVTVDKTILITGTVTLDLNGKTLTGRLLVGNLESPAYLTIKDSGTGGELTSSEETISVNSGSLTLESGTVSSSASSSDVNGIVVGSNTTMTLKGGTVSAPNGCVAIYVVYNGSVGGSTTLYAEGGTVNGTVKTILGNITHSDGVTDSSTTFTGTVKNGGTIAWGTYSGTVKNGYLGGSEGYNGAISGGTFNGTVTNYYKENDGVESSGNGTMTGGTFNGLVEVVTEEQLKKALELGASSIGVSSEDMLKKALDLGATSIGVSSADMLKKALELGASSIQLTGNITLTDTLTIAAGKTITLDLNGHVLKRTGDGSVIKVEGSGKLTLTDSAPTTAHSGTSLPAGGIITGGTGTTNSFSALGGGVYVDENGTFNISGGSIVGCTATSSNGGYGGGVYVGKNGTFNMSGGSIVGCTANYGGGVYINATGRLEMSGNATIRNCTAKYGGGVYIADAKSASDPNTWIGGRFTMSGGNISDCTATSDASTSGSVHIYCHCSFTMSGGTVNGAVKIHAGSTLNANGGTISGDVENRGTITRTATDTDISTYTTFSGTVTMEMWGAGRIEDAACPYTVTFDLNGGTGTAPAAQKILRGQKATSPDDPTNGTNIFDGWYTDNTNYTKKWTFATDTVTGSITLYAKWVPTHAVTFNANGGTLGEGTMPSQRITHGGTVAEPAQAPTRTGDDADDYVFGGWYEKVGTAFKENKFNFSTEITNDITLYARWLKNINKLDITLTIDNVAQASVSNASVTYNGELHTVGFVIKDGDHELVKDVDYTLLAGSTTAATDVGSYELQVSGMGSYAGATAYSWTGGWQITAASVTVKADDITVYVGDDMPTLTYTATGLVEGEDLGDAVTLSCDTADTKTAGTYTITPSGAAAVGNYTVTYESGTLTVAERSDGLAWLLPVLGALDKEPFDDVKTSDWFYDDVQYAYETGLMTGTGSRTFSPDAPVTRGMVMTILARREGIRTEHYSPWYAAGVEWAVVNGISDGTNPEAEITREELATMLYRYAKLRGYDLSGVALTGYTDAGSVSGYAVPAMQWAVHSGLINGAAGVNAGKLLPRSTATRAQLAAILHRFFG